MSGENVILREIFHVVSRFVYISCYIAYSVEYRRGGGGRNKREERTEYVGKEGKY